VHEGLVDAALAPLPEGLGTPVDFALEGLHPSVSKIMFYQVLLQSKLLAALVTHPLFVNFVYFHVPFQTVLRLEDLAAPKHVTPKSPLTLLIY
jgi:hypothetical protein